MLCSEFVRGLPIAKTRAEADLPYKQVFVYAEERSTADMPAMYKAANGSGCFSAPLLLALS